MPNIRTRAAKGAPLTNAEIDDMHRRTAVSVTADYTATVANNRDILLVNGTSLTVTLGESSTILSQAETGDYRLTIVCVGDPVDIDAVGGDTINGESSITLSTGESVTLVAMATGYVVSESHIPSSAFLPDALIPSGTRMLFQQTTPPTGWTKVTSGVDGRALRVVSGTVGSGGTNSFTTAFNSANTSSSSGTGNTGSSGAHTHSGNTGSTTLTVNQIPSHQHLSGVAVRGDSGASQNAPYGNGGSITDRVWEHHQLRNDAIMPRTESIGGGQGHTHTISSDGAHTHTGPAHTHTVNLDVLYLDVIIAQRD